MKECTKCLQFKPLDDFYRASGMRDGHRNDCKVCDLAAKKARYLADPATAIARVTRWQRQNRDRVNESHRRRRSKPEAKRADRAGHLKRKYGMTIELYEEILSWQGGVCAVCGREPRPDISLHVDHDHGTKKIRGLLCFRCNNALGDLGDDPGLLMKAASYLASFDESIQQERDMVRQRVRDLALRSA